MENNKDMKRNETLVISAPIANGKMVVTIDSHEPYPYTVVEFVMDEKADNVVSNPQVLVDYPDPDVDNRGIQATIFDDPYSDNSTKSIKMKTF